MTLFCVTLQKNVVSQCENIQKQTISHEFTYIYSFVHVCKIQFYYPKCYETV